VQRRGNAERVPGAVGPIHLPTNLDPVRRRNAGEGRSHSNGLAVRLEQEHAARLQPGKPSPDLVGWASQLRGYPSWSRGPASPGELAVNDQLDAGFEVQINPRLG